MKEVREKIKIPVIIGGGAGAAEDVACLLRSEKADAVCCASIFHYDICSIPELKNTLSNEGLEVRV